MWLETNHFAINPKEDLVLTADSKNKAIVPLSILEKLIYTFPKDLFSAILVEITDIELAKKIIPFLIMALENKGILVVAIGAEVPDATLAEVIISTATSNKNVVIPPLMVRYKRVEPGFGYAFRFKKENPIDKEKPAKIGLPRKKVSTKTVGKKASTKRNTIKKVIKEKK